MLPDIARNIHLRFFVSLETIKPMVSREELLEKFGKRVQRCYGCFIPFHLKDMYMGEDVTYYCENCKDDDMFHFSVFSKLMDVEKLREAEEDHHH